MKTARTQTATRSITVWKNSLNAKQPRTIRAETTTISAMRSTENGREMSTMKKQLEDVKGATPTQLSTVNSQLSTVTSQLSTLNSQLSTLPSAEDAVAEEYVEPEMESLNLNDLSRQMLEKALERNGGNRKKAALELGISDRTLYRRLKQYGLDK